MKTFLTIACCSLVISPVFRAVHSQAKENTATVTAKNNLPIARPSETVELQWVELKKPLPSLHPNRVRVKDAESGEVIVHQVVDADGDGRPDQLIFQGDFKSNETKRFTVEAAPDWQPRPESPIHCGYYDLRGVARHGKVIDEDDFAWENDRIAFRVYGPTTAKFFVSSGVDVWMKRVPYPILDKWHDSVKSFHADHGEGGDFYSVGGTRGCGGVGLWRDGKLYVSGNFVSYKVLANGPIRAIFEVEYAPWDAGGIDVSERKRISLDAGWNLSRHEITFQTDSDQAILYAIGLGKLPEAVVSSDTKNRRLGLWGPVNANRKSYGQFGIGVVVEGARPVEFVETDRSWPYAKVPGHHLAVTTARAGEPAVHYCGAAWSRWGEIKNAEQWFDYLDHRAKRVSSPLEIEISTPNEKHHD